MKEARYLYVKREPMFDANKIEERNKKMQNQLHRAVDLLLELGYEVCIADEGFGICIAYADKEINEEFVFDGGEEEEDNG